MSRSIGIAAVLLVAGCGKKAEEEQKTPPPPAADAAPAAPTNDGEPTMAAPAPTVKAGGKGDCKTDYAPRPTRDPNPMCKIAGGTFVMGAPDSVKDAWEEERPQRKVTLSPYYLDQFEVTVAQVVHYLNAVKDNACASSRQGLCFLLAPAASSPIGLQDGRYAAKPGTEREPFAIASPEGMERYCAWAGKQLVTDAQWEFAARHDPETGKDLLYPWGDTFQPKRANCKEADCADGYELHAPVGSFDAGASPWGVHDLAGNAGEITRDCFQGAHPACEEPCQDPSADGDPTCKRAARTLSWSSGGVTLRATFRQESTGTGGFRCAR